MNKIVFLILLSPLFIVTNLVGQTKFSDISKFFNSVVYICNENVKIESINGKIYEVWLMDKDSSYIPYKEYMTGSGFLISKELDLYLVTAEHVAKSSNLQTKIFISKKDGSPKEISLKSIVKDTSRLDWTVHKIADVAVIQLNEKIYMDSLLNVIVKPYDIIAWDLEAPIRERELTIYGYPLNLGIGRTISPITKTSKAASGLLDLPRFDNGRIATFYLLGDPSLSGFSGGPVFELS